MGPAGQLFTRPRNQNQTRQYYTMKTILTLIVAVAFAVSASAYTGSIGDEGKEKHKCSEACKDGCKAGKKCPEGCTKECCKKSEEKK